MERTHVQNSEQNAVAMLKGTKIIHRRAAHYIWRIETNERMEVSKKGKKKKRKKERGNNNIKEKKK